MCAWHIMKHGFNLLEISAIFKTKQNKKARVNHGDGIILRHYMDGL
jgi:glyoxylate utilization-related uncharacterized protein